MVSLMFLLWTQVLVCVHACGSSLLWYVSYTGFVPALMAFIIVLQLYNPSWRRSSSQLNFMQIVLTIRNCDSQQRRYQMYRFMIALLQQLQLICELINHGPVVTMLLFCWQILWSSRCMSYLSFSRCGQCLQ